MDVLNASGGALTSAQNISVIGDINATGSGVTASRLTGVYSSLFKGYDVLLTSTAPAVTGATYYLGIDFSTTADQHPATQGFTVGAIGVWSLLLGRRKNHRLPDALIGAASQRRINSPHVTRPLMSGSSRPSALCALPRALAARGVMAL